VGEVVVAIVVATVRCAWVANFYRIKPELSNLPTTEKRFVKRKKFF